MDISNPNVRYQPSSDEDAVDESFALLRGADNLKTSRINVFFNSELTSDNDKTNQTKDMTPKKKEEEKPLFWFWITLGSALLLFFMLLFLGVFALIWRIIHGETVKDILWTK
uniref:Uncharacterized protein n=1 Tax=Panagrolaimus sp. ES5 TaxID=591445 RepID=A0AC34GCW0_9BILA